MIRVAASNQYLLKTYLFVKSFVKKPRRSYGYAYVFCLDFDEKSTILI